MVPKVLQPVEVSSRRFKDYELNDYEELLTTRPAEKQSCEGLHYCSAARLTALLLYCSTALLLYCITTLLCCSTTLLQYYTASWHVLVVGVT